MNKLKLLNMSISMVKHSKLRSWLTIIGIVVGVASVITIISTGELFQDKVSETIESFGGSTISLQARSNGGSSVNDKDPELTRTDVMVLQGLPVVKYVNPKVSVFAEATYGTKKTNFYVEGVDPGVWPQISDQELLEGRMFTASDRNVILITNDIAENSFDREVGLNQMINLNGKSFRVIGILDDNRGMSSFMSSGVYIPYKMAYEIPEKEGITTSKKRDVYDSIEIKLADNADYNYSMNLIKKALRTSRHVTESNEDFSIFSSKDILEGTQDLLNYVTIFLAFIAGIALLVGSLGIANTMFTSVMEKTKEIGIMKAIGAKNRDILMLFLFNSALIGLIGGILGAIIGIAITQVVAYAIAMQMETSYEFVVSINGIIISLGVSILAGLISGVVPAYNASKLKPVDALRHD
ncbi:ABC transporter permease [Methanococcus voltae]|uniref:ABC3 transporter permease protein domain-containing protein n=1 Tax=Methanococcus voltae (strain ATCC BAA-1334 / A3) TaxID=456320 RepID=D7DUM1_METV3|nr:ABC transporter permease [Methanococcus voltae]MCS3900632.1 putative ABC transport system permease protein [Methanococcus voltae]